MPSIMMTWRGQCPGRTDRVRLVQDLTELAEIAREKFDTRYERYDREIAGRILLHTGVFGERRVPPSLLPHPTNQDLYCLETAQLFGIEFRLPTIYSGRRDDDRITFVFLCADDEPNLDGFLVRVHDAEDCRNFRDPDIQAADWLLTAPHIHLRYSFEQWTSSLLAWVRVYHMPDLTYSEFDHLEGDYEYDEYGPAEHLREYYFRRLKKFTP